MLRNLKDDSLVKFAFMTLDNEIDNMPEYVSRCQSEIQNVLAAVPPEWDVDKGEIEYSVGKVFYQEWIEICKDAGFEYIGERLRIENRNI